MNQSEPVTEKQEFLELHVFIEPLKPRNLESSSSEFEQQGEHYSFPIYFQSSERRAAL